MKKTLLVFCILLAAVKAAAFEPTFLDEPVTAVVGASLGEAQAHDLSPFQGESYNNGAYLDLSDALIREGLLVSTEAEGGATSYDQYNTDGQLMWTGIQKQVDKVLSFTPIWPDRIDSIVFTLLNDCIHSVQCTEADMDAVWQRVYDAAETAHLAGKLIIINRLPPWESVKLAESMLFYFGPGVYTISEQDYAIYKGKQDAKFGNVPWIKYIDVWEKASVPMDGLHFDQKDMKRAAHIVSKIIKDYRK